MDSDTFPLNLNSPNDSKLSTLSTVQDLNSASSLSWAEDEVENLATLRIQFFLKNLDSFLETGIVQNLNCYSIEECQQWRQLILNFRLQDTLINSKIEAIAETKRLVPRKKDLAVTGQSVTHFNRPSTRISSSRQSFIPLRTRSAMPTKLSVIQKSTTSARLVSSLSSHPDSRQFSKLALSTNDYQKLLENTARLNISKVIGREQINRSVHLQNGFSKLKRPKMPANLLPKMENVSESSLLPLPELDRQGRSFKMNLKSANPNHAEDSLTHSNTKQQGDNNSAKKPRSALHKSNLPFRNGPFYHALYNATTPTFRSCNNNIDVSVIGTSYDPVVRPIRSSKLRITHT